ncbi:MAG: S41 family peptidase [Chloroflexota bacterium]|nr:S41 family peptidase [Chloroflexota bacterium]
MSKNLRIVLGIVFALIILAGTFSAGIVVGNLFTPQQELSQPLLPTKEPPPNAPEKLGEPEQAEELEQSEEPPTPQPKAVITQDDLFAPFWEAWNIVHNQYVDQPVDDILMMRGAISGMLDSLGDQHTSYMDPEQFIQANIPMEGEYEGIGAWVDTNAEYLTIVSPMPNSPAEKAGLKPGDEIVAIDGDDVSGIDGNLVIKRVLGPAGTDVVLTIRRKGEVELFDVTVTRAKITIPSVEYRVLEDHENIGYIQITSFAQDTRAELRKGIKEVLSEDVDGIIIDLRYNGGGYLQSAIEVASEFISKGVILYEDYGNGEVNTFEAMNGGKATDIPLVFLVNEGSASASEIVAGAIQDHERAPLVGMTTFGKGSVQNWIPLSNEQGAVRVTIARWLTPDERQIHEIGLEPDYVVEFTEEDYDAGIDPQLEKAIEVLLEQLGE